ncbi:MAG: hypothetical protein EOP19_00185 [Hyphomicrobiales bacterium]|nr:MAG: hypothetical protein EOP19_00185 [Hyphomicrobiales bacterium]
MGDVARGVTEMPAAVVIGGKSAINATGAAIEEVVNAVESFLHLDEIPGGFIGYKGLDGDKSTPVELIITSRKKAIEQGFANLTTAPFDADKLDTAEGNIKSNTGNFIKSASQFATGWLTGGKLLKGWKVAGGVGSTVKALAQGAIADFSAFDAQEGNLSKMLNELAPDLRNPVTEFLANDEDTPELIGRAKNALEGAGLGVMVDTVMGGLRAMKAVRKAKAAVKAEAVAEGYTIDPTLAPEAAEKVSAKLDADVAKKMKPAGAKKVDAAAKTVNTDGLAADLVDEAQAPNAFDLPMHRFNTPEDVQKSILKMAERNATDIDKARRGVQDWANTKSKASAIDAIESMAVRKRGDAINAETVVAYKQALIAANEKLTELARSVANPETPTSLADQLALRRMAATTHAIQMEFMGARAEAGRALQAFKITDEANPYRGLDLETQLREAGGAKGAQELADAILASIAKKGHALDVVSGWDHFGAAIKTTYVNGLLSGFGTPVANVLGSGLNMAQDGINRLVADAVSKGMGEMVDGESIEYLLGVMGGMRDAFRLRPAEALPEGVARAGREEGRMMSRSDDPRIARPLSAAAWQGKPLLGIPAFRTDEGTPLGRVLDLLDLAVRGPQIVNQTADDYFAAISAQGSIRADAYRMAKREGEAQGWTPEQVKERQVELMTTPTRDMLANAERHMQEMTFTRDDGGFEQALQKVRKVMDTVPGLPIGTAFAPFLRTPANIISTGIRNGPLAPFSARWRDDLAAGGVRQQMALTQFAVGTGLWGLYMEMTMNGDMTGSGPRNRAQRQAMEREGVDGGVSWQANSIRVGDRWVQYSRFEPLGQSMGLAADYMELLANSDWDEGSLEEYGEVAAHVIASMGKAFFDKNMLNGTFDLVAALTGGDPAAVERELGNRGSGAIPFSGALRMARRAEDPYMRETSRVVDDMKNTLPGQSDDLAVQRDLWGRPRTYQSGLGMVYDTINLVKTRKAGANTIDIDMLDLGVSVTMPSRSFTIDGVSVSLKNHADIYSEYVRRAGEPAFEQLEAVTTGNHPDSSYYFSMTDGPNGEKAAYIKSVVSFYRKAAKDSVMEDYAAELMRLRNDAMKRRENARSQ